MDVVTLGETMALFTPESSPLMRYASTYTRDFGGAETNVAIGLARLGHQVGWISRLGKDELGKVLYSAIRGEGVDVSCVKLDDTASTGLYFKEVRSGQDVRVTYYRKGSAASQMQPDDLNEAYIARAKYLHLTGITPAISESCYETVMHAIELAHAHDVQVVFDPNLRRKLWSEDRAKQVLLEVTSKADIVLPGVDEGYFLFHEKDPLKLGQAFLELGAKLVVLKVGAEGAYYFQNNEVKHVTGFKMNEVIDPVGAGDGFAAGFLSGLLHHFPIEEAVSRGNAVGALVTQYQGDYVGLPDEEELDSFMNHSHKEDIRR